MADVIRYVDRDANGGGTATGTTWADAYPDMVAWQTAEATDLVTAGDRHIVRIRWAANNPHPRWALDSASWVTDADNYIIIEVDSDARHNFQLDVGTSFEDNFSSGAPILLISVPYTVVDGVRVVNFNTVTVFQTDATNCTIHGVLAKGVSQVFLISGDDSTLQNCASISDTFSCFHNNASGTIVFNSTGITYSDDASHRVFTRQSASVSWISCYGMAPNAATVFHGFGGDLTNCYSDDGTEGSTLLSAEDAGFLSLEIGSEDFRLSGSSGLIDQGQDNSLNARWWGDSVDVLGTTRPQGDAWDIGAHEYMAVLPLPHIIYG